MMTQAEIIRSNAKVILQHVRGKPPAERRKVYAELAVGPLLIGMAGVLDVSKVMIGDRQVRAINATFRGAR
jgi:hypothetical protein